MLDTISIRGAREHNLKGIDLDLPRGEFIVITGLSGSGKSSLAFDTLYAEGHRRYVESLSTYARQFLERVDKPDVDYIEGVSPAIAIEQRNPVKHSRSTVGTATEVYDYLRLLYAKVGETVCPACDAPVRPDTVEAAVDRLLSGRAGDRAYVTFPVETAPADPPKKGRGGKGKRGPGKDGRKERLSNLLENLLARGFLRVWIGEELFNLSEKQEMAEAASTKSEDIQAVVDRLRLGKNVRSRLDDSLEIAFREGGGKAEARIADGPRLPFSRGFACSLCGRGFEPPTPLFFSFNNPQGACPECGGFGNKLDLDLDLAIPDRTKTLAGGAVDPWTRPRHRSHYQDELRKLARREGVDLDVPFGSLPKKHQRMVIEGTKEFRGVRPFFERLNRKKYKIWVRMFLRRYLGTFPCSRCRGARLREDALYVQIAGRNISEVSALSVRDLRGFLDAIDLSPGQTGVAEDILAQLRSRLDFLAYVGVDYLTLDRLTRTLSSGEAQRINLANQLGAQLAGTLYILDEPTVGLHPSDNAKLLRILKGLTAAGNTVVIVEHDRDVIREADFLVDLGPGAGERGGEVVFAGPAGDILSCEDSVTASYLRGEREIPLPERRRPVGDPPAVKARRGKPARPGEIPAEPGTVFFSLLGAGENNLKGIDFHLPLGTFTCVTGVSGSGKSTLVHDTLYQALHRIFHGGSTPMGRFREVRGVEALGGVVLLDQAPIGRTPRSNPVTYIKAYDAIRRLFAETTGARLRRYGPGHFSFNVTGGRCERCKGDGHEKIEMHFMADLFVRCPECEGKRFRPSTLEVRHRGKNIHDVLSLTVDGALRFFSGEPSLVRRLEALSRVGLGYIRLGQPATTLSGGEAQRLKIAVQLAGKDPSRMLYILDEPTTGLHFQDVAVLLRALHRLVALGNTVLVIEHNLDVVKTADHIVDLGPGGGDGGGRIVARGTPEEVADCPESLTGRHLRPLLETRARDEAVMGSGL
ncbi:MAG TPA: excinuclease ABC subunit UvrA [Nitrospinota bacterium]|nr:excinuclease ABC subunit UvrA [Nitrospinota bacterium]